MKSFLSSGEIEFTLVHYFSVISEDITIGLTFPKLDSLGSYIFVADTMGLSTLCLKNHATLL